MGSPSAPKASPLPPTPEIKKRTDEDARKQRDTVRNAAIQKFGLLGTDVTKGALTETEASVKKKTLGG